MLRLNGIGFMCVVLLLSDGTQGIWHKHKHPKKKCEDVQRTLDCGHPIHCLSLFTKNPCCRKPPKDCEYTCYGQQGKCFNGGKCVHTDTCECPSGGYTSSCQDVDECAVGNGSCQHLCTNTVGSYTCSCRPGYTLDKDGHSCSDVNECLEANGGCDQICVNELGSHRCECLAGFFLQDKACKDIDECENDFGSCQHRCQNNDGSYSCSCDHGYSLQSDGQSCAPVCEEQELGVCPNGGVCILPGVCSCPQGFSEPHCEDVHECEKDNGGCTDLCVELPGSYRCDCNQGYELLPDNKTCSPRCSDVLDIGKCPNGGTCVAPGICACPPGFQAPTCTNIDECLSKNGGCSQLCTDTEGSYICSCRTGFTEEGKSCTDVDECSGSHGCSDICVNTQGSYTCQCQLGYQLSHDNARCEDVDECSEESSACEQICQNTEGSYTCECRDGFLIKGDGKQCVELRVCDSEGEVGCARMCISGEDGECTCSEGFKKQAGLNYCVDPCWSSPCHNGGRCVTGRTDEFISCDCSGTGFDGDHCEMGHLEIPSSLTVSKSELHPGILIRAQTADDVVIWADSESDVSVYPNPIRLQGPGFAANISILTRTSGLVELTFNTSNSRISPSLYRMRVLSNDVFRRLRLHENAVPKGCFYLTVATDREDHTFSSTSPWFRRKTENRVLYTFGVTHYVYPQTALPLTVDGLQVTHGTSVRISNAPRDVDADDVIRHQDVRDESCQEVSFSSTDLEDFQLSRSLLKSLCESIKPVVPYWLRFVLIQPFAPGGGLYRPQIVSGREVRHHPLCKEALTEDHIAYIVILFGDGFDLELLGQLFRIPPGTNDILHCLVLDFRHNNALTIVLNSDTSGIMEKIPFAAEILQASGIKVYPKLFAISDGWSLNELYNDHLTFFNGATMFDYNFPDKVHVHAGIWANKVISTNDGFDFAVQTTANLFSDRDPEYLFTHLNARPLDVFIHFDSLMVSMTLSVWGKNARIHFDNILDGDRAVLATGGDGDRDICGRDANPHGIFAQVELQSTLFPSLDIISEFVFMAESEAYFFLTFDDREDAMMGWTKPAVDSLLSVLRTKTLGFKKYMDRMKKNKGWSRMSGKIDEMQKALSNIVRLAQNFDTTNITTSYFGDFSRNVSINSFRLTGLVQRLESEAKLDMEDAVLKKIPTINKYLDLVKGTSKNVWWTVFDGSQPYFPSSHTWGLKVPIAITILGSTVGVEATFILSPENLMVCSSLREYYDHIQGGKATRVVGTVIMTKDSEPVLERSAMWLLWQFFPTYEGGSFELAMSTTQPLFAARIQVAFTLFGIQMSTNLFITNHEIVAMVEANIWNLFRARIRVGAEIPYKLNDLAIWVKGDFLPGSESSLESSFWEAVSRVIARRKKTLLIRLRVAKERAQRAQEALTNSQEDMDAARKNLDSKQAEFDKAVERLETAKVELQKAKKPFQKANRKLKQLQQKVDLLCSLQDCDRCVKQVTRANCKSNKQNGCVKIVPCRLVFSKMSCKLKNAACKSVRAAALGSLYVARAAVVLPMIALDAAKGMVSLAQIIVDKSRFLLDVAKGVYTAAIYALELGKKTLSLTEKAIDFLVSASNKLFHMAKNLVENTLQKTLDIKKCGFKVELSYRNWFELSAYCKVNFLSRGWKKYSFSLNFKDILGSMFGIAMSSVNTVEGSISEGRRIRRSAVLEELDTDSYNPYLFDQINNDTVLEAETWLTRCERFNAIALFLNTSIGVLKNLSRDVIEEADEIEQEIATDKEEEFRWEGLRLEDTSIDPLVALEEFNLTRDDLELAINGSDLKNDQYLKTSADFSRIVKEYNAAEIERMRRSYVIQDWVERMEEEDHLGDCLSLSDCISWSFGEIRGLLDTVQDDLVSFMFEDLAALESHFQKILRNDSRTANDTINLELDFTILSQLSDLLCETTPVISTPPANATVALRESAEFRCLAENSSRIVYYWYKGDNLTLSGEQATVFTLQNVTEQEEGDYACVAGNHVGNASAEHFHVRVVQPPTILTDLPEKIDLYEDVEFTIPINITGIPIPRISWVVCSSTGCQNLTNGRFLDTLKKSAGSELICRYIAQNELGERQSREVVMRMSRAHPACPSRAIELAYTVVRAARDNSRDTTRVDPIDKYESKHNDSHGLDNKGIIVNNDMKTSNGEKEMRSETSSNHDDKYNDSDNSNSSSSISINNATNGINNATNGINNATNGINIYTSNRSVTDITESKSEFSKGTSLSLKLEAAFQELTQSRLRSVNFERQKLDMENRIISALMTLDCRTDNGTQRNNATKSSTLLARMSQAVDSLRLVVESSYELLTHEQSTYSLNPAYLRLERMVFTCPEEWERKELHRCVKQPQRLILDAPENLDYMTTVSSAILKWEAPEYAKHLAMGHTVVIAPLHNEAATQYYNISSTATTFTFDPSVCYDGCRVKVRVYTASRESAWASTEVTFANTADLEPPSSPARDLVWVIIVSTAVMVFLCVSILASCVTNRKSNKIVTFPDNNDDKNPSVFAERSSKHPKKVRWADHRSLLDRRPDSLTDVRAFAIEQKPRALASPLPAWDQAYVDSIGVYDCVPRPVTPMVVLATDLNARDTSNDAYDCVAPSVQPIAVISPDMNVHGTSNSLYDSVPQAATPVVAFSTDMDAHGASSSLYDCASRTVTPVAVLSTDVSAQYTSNGLHFRYRGSDH